LVNRLKTCQLVNTSPHLISDRRALRAQRILDAATLLLQRWGYSRVTIDDIAKQAGIGKGTIYLHWPSREAVFHAALQRELFQLIEEFMPTLREHPEELLLHRLVRYFWLAATERPLIRAIVVQDLETLGRLVRAGDQLLISQQYEAFEAYLELLKRHRLIRADLTAAEIMFIYRATLTGFFVADNLVPEQYQPALERKADLLASVFQRSFEIPDPAPARALAAVAPILLKLLEKIAEAKRAAICPPEKSA
jgi:AcrR family transcriptional regulator